MYHVTQAKRSLKTLLLNQLPIKLANADAVAADGVISPPPYEIHTTDKAALGGHPSLELIATDSSKAGKESHAQIYRHRVVIGVTVGGDDEETLTVVLERYIWCIRQVCWDTLLTPDGGTGPIDSGGEQYTPLAQAPKTVEYPFVKGGFIEVFVKTLE